MGLTALHHAFGIEIRYEDKTVKYPNHVNLFTALTDFANYQPITEVFIADLAKPLSVDKARQISRLFSGVPVYFLGVKFSSGELICAFFKNRSVLVCHHSGSLGEHTIYFKNCKIIKVGRGWQDNLDLLLEVAKVGYSEQFGSKSEEELECLEKSLIRRKNQDFLQISYVEANIRLYRWITKNKLSHQDLKIIVERLLVSNETNYPSDEKIGSCFDNSENFNSVLFLAMKLFKQKVQSVHYQT